MSQSRRRMLMGAASGSGDQDTGIFLNNGNPIVFHQTPLVYENNQFRFQTSWNEITSYGTKFGKVEGSTYFGFDDVYGIDLDGYRLLTNEEFQNTLRSVSYQANRPGCTYTWDGGSQTGARYAGVHVSGGVFSGIYGVSGHIIFPDEGIITGPQLTINGYRTLLTIDQVNSLIKQKCLFLPCMEYCNFNGSGWNPSRQFNQGYYWLGTENSVIDAILVHSLCTGLYQCNIQTLSSASQGGTKVWNMPVILCRDA